MIFWWWALETIIHRAYPKGFSSKQKKLHFTRPNFYINVAANLENNLKNPGAKLLQYYLQTQSEETQIVTFLISNSQYRQQTKISIKLMLFRQFVR